MEKTPGLIRRPVLGDGTSPRPSSGPPSLAALAFGRLTRTVLELATMGRRVAQLESRLANLEHAVDVMIASPKYAVGEGNGFNGQAGRRKIFSELAAAVRFDAVVETGAYFGDTAGFMHATTALPVYTCELHRRNYLIAKARLADLPGITVELNDSRLFLSGLAEQPLAGHAVFFYLDAHFYADLPLEHEIEIIARHWDRFVIMIDDFRVPGDSGYGYDRYRLKSLDLCLIAGSLTTHGLKAYVPTLPSSRETGRKRGCVVLVKRGPLSDVVSSLDSLRDAGDA